MNANLTCRLQEDQETSAVGADSEEEEEEVQQLVFGIDVDGGTGKAIQTLRSELSHTKKHFQNPCYCCNLPLLYFNTYHYSLEGQDFRVQLDARWHLAC